MDDGLGARALFGAKPELGVIGRAGKLGQFAVERRRRRAGDGGVDEVVDGVGLADGGSGALEHGCHAIWTT